MAAKITKIEKIKSRAPKRKKSSSQVFCSLKVGLKKAPTKVTMKIAMTVSAKERYSFTFSLRRVLSPDNTLIFNISFGVVSRQHPTLTYLIKFDKTFYICFTSKPLLVKVTHLFCSTICKNTLFISFCTMGVKS